MRPSTTTPSVVRSAATSEFPSCCQNSELDRTST
ncbi:Uncharacterised protein [Mycobacteroides abscessus]|nr:Uncharacterised protein [Mycobacteroides abscessus]